MTHRAVPTDRLPPGAGEGAGLDTEEVGERRRRFGPNAIVERASSPWLDLARDTARDPMIWFLAAAAALYAVVGQRTEAVTLLVALLPLVGMDVVLHRRTQASTEGLRGRLATRATAVRDGHPVEIPSADVVPGDLLLVTAGQPVPADGIVTAGADLQVDESTLTGEAYPVGKRPLADWPAAGAPPMVASPHWVFAGTRLLTGHAAVRVVFTGAETLYGDIVRSAVRATHEGTPLQRAIQRLVALLLAAGGVACLLLGAVRLLQGHGWVDAVLSAVTLAAAALPEEFPVVFTVFLGVGVYRLARRQALVRRAVSVENIGRVTCICTDKTGTITENRLRLARLVPADPAGDARLLELAALASRPDAGDPLDVAIAEAVARRGMAVEAAALARFPFTEMRARETVIVRDAAGAIAVSKGAAERLLAAVALSPDARRTWSDRIAALAADGYKVLACAWRPCEPVAEEPLDGYQLAGLLAFDDPVRDGVAEAVTHCRDAAIHTVVVTGDHPLTAGAVARAIGLGAGTPVVVSGDEMEELAARGGAALAAVDVVARATPAQKLTLVRALQEGGEIVAVTGDGVNDVPALRAADVGIAMGERGTRPAREAAAIVLLDDNFRTVVQAIAEGRQLFRNLRASFAYLIMIHVPFVAAAAALPLAGYPLLFLPVHVVWLELMIHPTAMLAFQQPPRPPRAMPAGQGRRLRLFSPAQWALMAGVGLLETAVVAAGYLYSAADGGGAAHGRAVALAALALASAAITAGLSRLRTRASQAVTVATIGVTAALVQTPALAAVLEVTPLHLDDWAIVSAGAAAGLLGVLLDRLGPGDARPPRERAVTASLPAGSLT
jgi:Ca2+-transporting ATPase